MKPCKLSEIARLFGAAPETEQTISTVCTDSRAITPGCLFVALEGERFDGHDFVAEAFCKGAAAAVCRKKVADAGGPVIYVANTLRALITIGCAYRLRYHLPVVAVTGSVGKTTTKDMIACVLAAHGKTLKTQGNRNNEIGLPMTLLDLDEEYRFAVLEMGMTHMGDLALLSTAALPNVAVITNIGVSHIENLGSRENILKAKLEITQGLPENGILILNYDDDLLSDIKFHGTLDIIAYGIDNPQAAVTAKNIVRQGEETTFCIRYKEKDYSTRIPCIGTHNVQNALAAFACAAALGLDLQKSADALAGYTPSGMRQKIVRRGGYTVIEDCYNASPDSMKAALTTLGTLKGETGGRAIAVLADMLELGPYARAAHEAVGVMAAQSGVDALIAYGTEAAHIAQTAQANGVDEVWLFTDKAEAAQKLLRLAKAGDIVLFKGSRGMRLEELVEHFYREAAPALRE